MTKPTREQILSIKEFWFNIPQVMDLCDSYLAQEEELEKERDKAKKLYDICVFNEQTMSMLLEHNRKLEAENQALKAELLRLEA